MPSKKSETTLSDEFLTESITLRGTTYTFKELSGSKYEEMLKLAEGPDGTADLATVLRLMIPESLVSPALTAEKIYAKPLPVVTAIQNLVNKMHFRAETADPESSDEAGEEEAPKNESEPETS